MMYKFLERKSTLLPLCGFLGLCAIYFYDQLVATIIMRVLLFSSVGYFVVKTIIFFRERRRLRKLVSRHEDEIDLVLDEYKEALGRLRKVIKDMRMEMLQRR